MFSATAIVIKLWEALATVEATGELQTKLSMSNVHLAISLMLNKTIIPSLTLRLFG